MGLLLCKWLLPVWVHVFHPFYMSVTEMRHNPQRKTLEVSCRIFTDDLEKALEKYNHTTLDIIQPKNRPAVDSMIARYIGQHLQIKADGKALQLKYLGYKIEEEAAWCFLEAGSLPAVHQINLQNDILYAEHEGQSHMLHAIVNDKRQSTKIDNPKKDAVFKF